MNKKLVFAIIILLNLFNYMEQENQKISKSVAKLVEVFKPAETEEKEVVITKIKVSEMVSKVAFFYEKIRNVIDYREDYLLRKSAIERMLKRRLSNGSSIQEIAKGLVLELIRGRYLPNNTIPEAKINEVRKILDKYMLLQNIVLANKTGKKSSEIFDWIVSVAACEIEECLIPPTKDEALVGAMYEVIKPKLVLKDKTISEEERDVQLYICIRKAFLKSDQATLSYKLLKLYYPDWPEAPENLIKGIAHNFGQIRNTIEKQLNNPLQKRLMPLCKKYAVLFMILRDVLGEEPERNEEILQNEEEFEEKIKEAYKKRYRKARTVLRRSAVRSILYIFITKMVLAILIELPIDLILQESLNYLSLGINILFPVFLMFLVALFIKLPSKKNFEAVVNGIKAIVYENVELSHKIKPVKSRGKFLSGLFYFIYSITFLISFGLIIFILYKLEFNIVSGIIFIFFLTLVSFFGIRIRQSARELVVIKKEGALNFLIDFFSLPIVRVGKWLSEKLSKINVFVYIMDFIIEAPFKTFIEIFEEWTSFVKEKKEEIF